LCQNEFEALPAAREDPGLLHPEAPAVVRAGEDTWSLSMKFTETKLVGAYFIDLERLEDERGYFARAWCREEFLKHGLDADVVQCNVSYNPKKGTLRGMHYQDPPHAETKLVRCTRGSVYDVIVDLRPGSPTFLDWIGAELSADNGRIMYVPKGFAHGFQTLEEHSMVFYQVSEFYAREDCRGIRWNDPQVKIKWPHEVAVISPQDKGWADLDRAKLEILKDLSGKSQMIDQLK
jgi:dTDP-4-dehydrorhamnose 3,5-epimerase